MPLGVDSPYDLFMFFAVMIAYVFIVFAASVIFESTKNKFLSTLCLVIISILAPMPLNKRSKK